MKQRMQGLAAGIIIGAIAASGISYAKSATKIIEVSYDNIKVYKDNVLCELKDSNGSTIEPFIYDGTTYLPVRGAAKLADMEVTWDGLAKSVYLWDELVPDGTYLLGVCPPYETSYGYNEYLQQKGKSFAMSGTKYSNGFTLNSWASYALFNLNSKFSSINFTIGHVDGSKMVSQTATFLVDGKVIRTIEIDPEGIPQAISIPVNYGLQLKVVLDDGNHNYSTSSIGFGNITVR